VANMATCTCKGKGTSLETPYCDLDTQVVLFRATHTTEIKTT